MKKKFWIVLIIGLMLLVGSQAFGADQNIYLDNAGAGAGTEGDPYGAFAEINWTTGGANSIFDWVAADDDVVINLKKGATWREQMTVQTSGVAGHPITIQSYGAGADPIINGADIVAGFGASDSIEIAESQITSNTESITIRGADGYFAGTCIQSAGEIVVPRIDLEMKKAGTPVGDVWVEIWPTAGTPSRPDGGTSTADSNKVDASTIGGSMEWVTFTFAIPPTLSAATDYFIIVIADYDASDANLLYWDLLTSDNYRGDDPYNRHRISDAAPPTSAADWNHDFSFKVYKNVVGDVYEKAGITTEPQQVFYDDVLLDENDEATTSVGANEWDWAADTLYINVGEDPAGGTVEISQRNIIWGASKNYITYDGLEMTKANAYGIYLDSVTNVTVQNCDINYNASYGITLATASADLLITKNNISYNGYASGVGSGIFSYEDAGTVGHLNYISENTVSNNFAYGMDLMSNYLVIEHNLVFDNGSIDTTRYPYGCNGIELVDLTNNGYASNVIVRYNEVYGQLSAGPDGTGIAADDNASNVDIYGNISYDNDGPGIGAWKANNINIYNNSVYGNMLDSAASHTNGGDIAIGSNAADVSNIVIKNNIAQATGATYPAIRIDANAVGTVGLDISNNTWIAVTANWYFWDAAGGNNLATWNALTGVGTDLNSDPLFTNAAGDDFTLQAGSPARNAGTYLPGYESKLKWTSTWPSAVLLMDDILSIGAYAVPRGAAGM